MKCDDNIAKYLLCGVKKYFIKARVQGGRAPIWALVKAQKTRSLIATARL